MLVEGRGLGVFHAAIALLHHLGVGDQPVEGDVDPRRLHRSEEAIQRDHDAPNRIVGVQIPMEEAVEVERKDIDAGGGGPFNGRVRTDQGPNIKGNPHTKSTRDGSNLESPASD